MYGERHFTYHLNQDELHKVWTVSSKPWGYQACIWWPYLRSVKWKECPLFCPEETVHWYQPCIYERVIPDYNACEGGKQLFVNTQRCLPYECQDSKETHTDLTSHAEEKKSVSTFNGQMNLPLLMKKKHLPTNQDPSYKDNLVEQMVVDIRLYTKWWRSQKPFLYYYYFLCVQ